MKNADTLKRAIIDDFKKEFDIELIDDDFEETEDGFDVSYYDYDLNKYEKYRHNPLVENYNFESDGRSEYLNIYAHLTPEDYGID